MFRAEAVAAYVLSERTKIVGELTAWNQIEESAMEQQDLIRGLFGD